MSTDEQVIQDSAARFQRLQDDQTLDDAARMDGIRDLIVRIGGSSLLNGPELGQAWMKFKELQQSLPSAPKAQLVPCTDACSKPGRHFYHSMPIGPRDVRLLTVHPKDVSDYEPPRCSMSVASLEDSPHYEAISYCWGYSGQTSELFVDGEKFLVNSSLAEALQNFRLEVPRVVWVDGLCINQDDWDERLRQVKLMDDIYSMASNVRVWLGHADERTETAFNSIRDIGRGSAIADLKDHRNNEPLDITLFLRCMLSVYERPWFERLWVMQEHWLCKRCFFHCGSHIVGTVFIDKTARAIGGSNLLDTIPSAEANYLFNRLLARLSRTGSTWSNINPGKVAMESNYAILSAALSLKCTNPKDRVFGLMGVAPFLKAMNVTYDNSVLEIYAAATLAVMREDKRLDLLCTVSAIKSDITDSSWIFAFQGQSLQYGLTMSMPINAALYNACKSVPLQITQVDATTLRLRGIPIGEISALGPVWPVYTIPQVGERAEGWRSKGETAHRAEQLKQWQEFLGVPDDDLWSVVNVDVIQDSTGLHRMTADAHARIHGLFQGRPQQHDRDLSQFYDANRASHINTVATNSKPFKTNTGSFGRAMQDVNVGDFVFVLAGSSFPYIFRKTSDEHMFSIVGPCYVQGAMDGEVVDRAVIQAQASASREAHTTSTNSPQESSSGFDDDSVTAESEIFQVFEDILVV